MKRMAGSGCTRLFLFILLFSVVSANPTPPLADSAKRNESQAGNTNGSSQTASLVNGSSNKVTEGDNKVDEKQEPEPTVPKSEPIESIKNISTIDNAPSLDGKLETPKEEKLKESSKDKTEGPDHLEGSPKQTAAENEDKLQQPNVPPTVGNAQPNKTQTSTDAAAKQAAPLSAKPVASTTRTAAKSKPETAGNGPGVEDDDNIDEDDEHPYDYENAAMQSPQVNNKGRTNEKPAESSDVKLNNNEIAYETDEESSNFFTYFLTVLVVVVLLYILAHNKQKILALLIEGRSGNSRRRPNTNLYKRLDATIDEVLNGNNKQRSPPRSSSVIY